MIHAGSAEYKARCGAPTSKQEARVSHHRTQVTCPECVRVMLEAERQQTANPEVISSPRVLEI